MKRPPLHWSIHAHEVHTHEVPPSFMAQDRDYFENHPGERVYHRPFIPGEIEPQDPPVVGAELMVQVEYLGEGARRRRFYWVLPGGGMG
jgi:hypothetical protein